MMLMQHIENPVIADASINELTHEFCTLLKINIATLTENDMVLNRRRNASGECMQKLCLRYLNGQYKNLDQ